MFGVFLTLEITEILLVIGFFNASHNAGTRLDNSGSTPAAGPGS